MSGYIVDAPATARGALEPLMAAYDFVAAERYGRVCFFHGSEHAPLELALGELGAGSASDLFAIRADSADAPIEARVRFLDPARDYLLAGVSARRLDRAEGGVETVEAPLVMEADAADALAQRLLADARAGGESLRLSLGPAHLALEPGDRVKLEGDLFEIVRIEDAEMRQLELRRTRTSAFGQLHLGEPSAPPLPAHAPAPVFVVLDLPLLPGMEGDARPLAAVFASPWQGAHDIYAGPSDGALTRRGKAAQPAVMGELLWAMWPGPIGR